MNTPFSLRKTGRTSRMIVDALVREAFGKEVLIIAANCVEVDRIKRLLPKATAIKVYTPTANPGWDWSTMRFSGLSQQASILVDHYAIECAFPEMLHELHRYDSPYYKSIEVFPDESANSFAKTSGRSVRFHA